MVLYVGQEVGKRQSQAFPPLALSLWQAAWRLVWSTQGVNLKGHHVHKKNKRSYKQYLAGHGLA